MDHILRRESCKFYQNSFAIITKMVIQQILMSPVLTVNRMLISDSLVFSDRVREESKLLIILRSRDEKRKIVLRNTKRLLQ